MRLIILSVILLSNFSLADDASILTSDRCIFTADEKICLKDELNSKWLYRSQIVPSKLTQAPPFSFSTIKSTKTIGQMNCDLIGLTTEIINEKRLISGFIYDCHYPEMSTSYYPAEDIQKYFEKKYGVMHIGMRIAYSCATGKVNAILGDDWGYEILKDRDSFPIIPRENHDGPLLYIFDKIAMKDKTNKR